MYIFMMHFIDYSSKYWAKNLFFFDLSYSLNLYNLYWFRMTIDFYSSAHMQFVFYYFDPISANIRSFLFMKSKWNIAAVYRYAQIINLVDRRNVKKYSFDVLICMTGRQWFMQHLACICLLFLECAQFKCIVYSI